MADIKGCDLNDIVLDICNTVLMKSEKPVQIITVQQ